MGWDSSKLLSGYIVVELKVLTQITVDNIIIIDNWTAVIGYGVFELRKAGSTDATLAVKNACIQNRRLCRLDVSTSWNQREFLNPLVGQYNNVKWYVFVLNNDTNGVLHTVPGSIYSMYHYCSLLITRNNMHFKPM